MTAPRGPDARRPFGPSELVDVADATPANLDAEARVAHRLEALADRTAAVPSPEFTDRVMAAIGSEPVPAPARLATSAIRRGALGAFVMSLRDAWRVTMGHGFPMAARAQALALVLVVAGLAAGSGLATVGALGLLAGPDGTPAPSVAAPSHAITPSPSVAPRTNATESPEATETPEPSESPEATETPEPSEEASDDHGGSGGGSDDDHETAKPREETRTPRPTDDDHEEEDGHTPEPSKTPKPSETPHDD